MTDLPEVSILLIAVSVLLFCAGLIWVFAVSRRQRTTKRLLALTLTVVAAILCLKAAEAIGRNAALLPSGILIETMQSFSLDADYAGLLDPIPGAPDLWAKGLVWYRVILYSVAPIAGGAVIYDVLAGISPELRLFLVRRRRLMIFSELNEKALLLAESLARGEKASDRFVIVFTDCYPSDGEESAELMMRAKELRAVCLQEDLLHCRGFRHSAEACFYLMDQDAAGRLDEQSNLIALEGLLGGRPSVWNEQRGCSITLFSDSSETIENVRALKSAFDARESSAPVKVHVIRDQAMACCFHLKEAPLYEDLDPETPDQILDLVILGRTPFAREMFRSVFWCGQLLDHPLRITLVAPPEGEKGGEPALIRELRRFSPELLESCDPDGKCLLLRPESPKRAPVYASLCFVEEDPSAVPLRELLTEERRCRFGKSDPFALSSAQRFLIMGGSDEENIALADGLRRALTYLREEGKAPGRKTISAVVERSETRRVVRARFQKYEQQDQNAGWLKMRLFGSLEDRYCWQTVSFDGEDLACAAEPRELEQLRHSLTDIGETSDDIYSEWSRVARAFHEPYKMFSAGARGTNEAERKLDYARKMKSILDGEDGDMVERLRWLEHRRWCAFLRAQGFSQPPRLAERICQLRKGMLSPENWNELWPYAYKNVPARLQPCLVECLPCASGTEDRDMLDCVSELRALVEAGKPHSGSASNSTSDEKTNERPHRGPGEKELGVKYYDVPYGEFGPKLTREDLLKLFAGESPEEKDREAWLNGHPGLENCQTRDGSGIYYLDLVLDQLEEDSKNRK